MNKLAPMACPRCAAAMQYAELDGHAEWSCTGKGCREFASVPMKWLAELQAGFARILARGVLTCEHCGGLLPATNRSGFYCRPLCRQRAWRQRVA